MVNIVFCGPAGAGKKRVLKDAKSTCKSRARDHVEILRVASRVLNQHGIRSREDYCRDDKSFGEVHSDIIIQQCHEETQYHDREIITDNCIIYNLAVVQSCLGAEEVEVLLTDSTVLECIERYKRSLVLLLCPDKFGYDDGICLKLSEESWSVIRDYILGMFRTYHIPFVEIRSADHTERVTIVKEALDGKIMLESSTLSYYQKGNEDQRLVEFNFLFHIIKLRQENSVLIPTIEITEHYSKQGWTCYNNGETNRFIAKEGSTNLACLNFHISVKSTSVQKTLLGGVFINGEMYSFLGCSANGLKNRKCFMLKGKPEDVEEVLKRNGDFASIKTVSKRLARIGLLFSGVRLSTIKVEEENIIIMKDIEKGVHDKVFNFTDGCGGIGEQLAKDLAVEICEHQLECGYIPSVFQVRFQGYKGVLAKDLKIHKNAIAVRPSMKKFETTAHPFIGVCDFSKPYTFGHLNKQFIVLLSGLRIKDSVFEERQNTYLDMLRKMVTHSESAIQILQWQNMFDVAQRINRAGSIDDLPVEEKITIQKKLKRLQNDMVQKAQKLNILIPESRNIFGVCDQVGILHYGQCFLRLTLSGKPTTIRGQVVVCKNPCYLLGDVRVLTAVDETDNPEIRKLHHLVDCIVFPVCGKWPHPNEIAGSDLDGDQFFVCWDKDLIPKSTRPAYNYPGSDSKSEGTISREKMIAYFASQNETQKLVARVDKYFHQWAAKKGPESDKCERLGQLFSKVIDASKTGEVVDIPRGLEPTTVAESESSSVEVQRFVWSKMVSIAARFEEDFTAKLLSEQNETTEHDIISENFVIELAQRTYTNIREYEKFVFIWNYIHLSEGTLTAALETFMNDYFQYVNFSTFTAEELKECIDLGIPSKMVLNALNSSKIVTEDELSFFLMDSPQNTWKHVVALDHDTFDWSHLLKAVTTNDNTLLVFKMPDGVVIELQILEKLSKGLEQPVMPGTFTGVLYSRHFDYKEKYVLGKEYVLDLTDSTLQLYRDGKKNLTFVWLNASDRKLTKGRWDKRLCEEVNNTMSVDLQRFNRRILNAGRKHPLINKMPFVKLEIYAQNGRGEAPYWDIADVNDLLPVFDEMCEETGNNETFVVDFDALFPKCEIDDIDDILKAEDLFQTLDNAAREGDLYKYSSVLSKWTGSEIPEECVFTFMKLLESLVTKITPLVLPDDFQSALIQIVAKLSPALKDPESLLQVISSLYRLGADDIVHQLLQIPLKPAETKTYLAVMEKWECLSLLDTRFVMSFVVQLQLSWTIAVESKHYMNDFQRQQDAYVHRLGILHMMTLVQEVYQNIEITKQASSESSGRQRASVSPNCITHLRVDRNAEEAPTTIAFYRTSALEQSAMRFKGQYVTIALQNNTSDVGDVHRVCCVGQIQNLNAAPFSVSVKIEGQLPEVLLQATRSEKIWYWRIDIIANIVTYQRVVKSLRIVQLATEEQQVICKVFQSSRKEIDVPVPILRVDSHSVDCERLNSSQREAVKAALEDIVSLIQGPPGTGKTEVACHLIREIVKSKHYNGILVVAETNVAVDNLTRRLRNDVVVVRVGPVEGVESDLYDVSLEGQVKVIAEREARKSKVRDKQGDVHNNTRLINRVLSAADVVLTTCAGAGDSRLENYTFPFVLVDEATQTLETTLLCSLVHGVKHLVMIGDPKQLGPISKEFPEGKDDPNLPKLDCLSETLFHRWYNEGFLKVSFLDVQYRMHPAIMQFPSSEFYDNKLKASSTTQNRLPIIFPWPNDGRPLCFIDIDGTERKHGTSFYNKSEVEAVSKAIDVLLSVDEESYRSHRIGVHQIGVITMYQGQVQKLKEVIQCAIKVSTVDGFQGQERDVIIVSTVRSNSRGSLGFSDDERRLNVLLTRAKRGLVVIGNRSTLQNSRTWGMWLKSAPQMKLENLKPVSGSASKPEDRQKGQVNRPQNTDNRDSSKRGTGNTKRYQTTIYKRR